MNLSAAAERFRHRHHFDEGNPLAERRTLYAVVLTALMMLAEIAGGWVFNSMALLADGWHMGTHALALGVSVLAYALARRHADDRRFAFGTWKIEILGGYTSAVVLAGVALVMAFESLLRLFDPRQIDYRQAILVAVIGLAVNLICAWLLHGGAGGHHGHDHGHHHGHAHPHDVDHRHEDLNLRSAYLHVLADAATSILAIAALFAGLWWGAGWLDPLMGIAGAILVGVWARGLLRDTGKVLLDAEMDAGVVDEIREVIANEPQNTEISDLHVWRVGKDKYACELALVTAGDGDAAHYRRALSIHEELVHVTVEVNRVAAPWG